MYYILASGCYGRSDQRKHTDDRAHMAVSGLAAGKERTIVLGKGRWQAQGLLDGRGPQQMAHESAKAASVSPLKITEAAFAWDRSRTPPPWSRDLRKLAKRVIMLFSPALVHRLPTTTWGNNPQSQKIT